MCHCRQDAAIKISTDAGCTGCKGLLALADQPDNRQRVSVGGNHLVLDHQQVSVGGNNPVVDQQVSVGGNHLVDSAH